MSFNRQLRSWHDQKELLDAPAVYRYLLTKREHILPALTRSRPVWVPYQVQSQDEIVSVNDMYGATYCYTDEESALYHLYDGSRTLDQASALRTDDIFQMYIHDQDIDPSSLKCKIFACFDLIDPADDTHVFAVVPEDCHLEDLSFTVVSTITCHPVGLPPDVDEIKAMAVVLFKPSKRKMAIIAGEPGKPDSWRGDYAQTVWNTGRMYVYFVCHRLVFEGNRLMEIKHHTDTIQGMATDDEDDSGDDEDDVSETARAPLAKRPRI